MKSTDYVAIRMWGQQLGSYEYFIIDEQAVALATNAPLDAIYRKYGTGEWVTVRDLRPDLQFCIDYAKEMARETN